MAEEKNGFTSTDDSNTPDGTATGLTLDLPARRSRLSPVPAKPAASDGMETLLCGLAAFVLGLVIYWLFVNHEFDLSLFEPGSLAQLLGSWTGAIGFIFASGCCLGSIALLRWYSRRDVPLKLAAPGAVALSVLIPVALVLILFGIAVMLFLVFGFFALFFHSGDR